MVSSDSGGNEVKAKESWASITNLSLQTSGGPQEVLNWLLCFHTPKGNHLEGCLDWHTRSFFATSWAGLTLALHADQNSNACL